MNTPSYKADVLEQQLRDLSSGITSNAGTYPGAGSGALQSADVDAVADQVHILQQDSESKESAAEQSRTILAQYIDTTGKQTYVKIRDQAYSTHGRNSALLSSYNLSKTKTPNPQPPETPTNPQIVQSSDGTSFIVTWNKSSRAKTYEVWYGASTNAGDTNTIPQMSFLATATKANYIHAGIVKGTRYFYAIKAINASGSSELSPPESRVAN